ACEKDGLAMHRASWRGGYSGRAQDALHAIVWDCPAHVLTRRGHARPARVFGSPGCRSGTELETGLLKNASKGPSPENQHKDRVSVGRAGEPVKLFVSDLLPVVETRQTMGFVLGSRRVDPASRNVGEELRDNADQCFRYRRVWQMIQPIV
ncbi:MAG: hypothetical protein N3G20_04815, partial [Verrucomicrobiae bacterium]|nr:hypothetical protein [Verrucomicrobiae bacterium]